ncbi:MAG: hypothetical protein E7419_06905 [Ruminococcaceae bacterium]|nr:hypothetical protein [Oscillospiraceae bacterium]
MLKRFLAIAIVLSLTAGMITIPALADDNEEYKIFWEEDFDTGYLATDTQIKNFDKFETANTKHSDGVMAEVPEYWDGTFNYSTSDRESTHQYPRDFNSKVIRKVEDGNGMMSFQHVGTGTTLEVYVEKTFAEPIELIPELIVEYKVRMTAMGGSSVSFNLRTASSAYPARIQGPQFARGYKNEGGTYGLIRNYDSDNNDNIGFTWGTSSKPNYDVWHSVKVVHSNVTNTRDTYIDGVYVGTADNNAYASYYKNGKLSLRFEVAYIAADTVVDVDDIVVKAKKLSSGTPSFMQNGVSVSEYEYSEDPISVKTDVINYDSKLRAATLYLAAYGGEGNNKKLVSYTAKTVNISPNSKQTIKTDDLVLPSGVSEVKAYIWDGLLPLNKSGSAEKAIFESSTTGMPEFSGLSEIGNVSFIKKVEAATTGYTKDGLRTFMALVGSPGYIYEFDTYTGKFLNSYEFGSAHQTSLKIGSDGKVYAMGYSNPDLYVYDPETKKNTLIQADICEGSNAWYTFYGADGDTSMLYSPIYNSKYETEGSYVIEYDIDNKKVSTYKGFGKGIKYSHAATGDENYIYAGSADSSHVATISRLDKKTGEIVTYVDEQGRVPGSIVFIKVIGDYIFANIGNSMIVLNKNTMEKVTEFDGGRGQQNRISDPDPNNPDLVYFSATGGKTFHSFNLKTLEVKNLFTTTTGYGNFVRYDFGRWFPDKYGNIGLIGIGGQEAYPGIFHIRPDVGKLTHKYTDLLNKLSGIPAKPQFFYVSRDDILYVSGLVAGLNGYDLKTNTPLFTADNGQQHALTMTGGKVFGGSYGGSCTMQMYDPLKSFADGVNPKSIQSTSGVNRFYHTKDTNAGFSVISGIADYGNPEGGVILVSYFDDKPHYKIYLGVIKGENITGVEYKDGYLYASSSVNVPQHETHEEAHVAKIDAKTGNVVKTVTVNFDGLSKTTKIGELCFGPDGLLYGKANVGQTIFALDPDDLSVVKYKSFYPDKTTTASYMGERVFFGDEGVLYAVLDNNLHTINIENWDYVRISGTNTYTSLDNDGNILRQYGANSLAKIHVNQRQRLEIMIENASKYYKEKDYSQESFKVFSDALNEAKAINISEAYLSDITKMARKLGFAIRDLQTVFDYDEGYAFPFK